VQPLQHDDQPSRDHPAGARLQSLCRQPRADAGVFPDYLAPVVRNTDGEREMAMRR